MTKIWIITHRAKNGPDDEFVMIGYTRSPGDARDQVDALNAEDPHPLYTYAYETLEYLGPTAKTKNKQALGKTNG